MKLKEIGIKNFRGYKAEKRVPVDADVTGITGRNDVGKSTILEALDIFFPGGETTIDKDDFNVSEPDGSVEIRCIFDGLPTEIVIDEANKTTLANEQGSSHHARSGARWVAANRRVEIHRKEGRPA